MRKIIIFISFFIFVFLFLPLFLFNVKDVFASSCSQFGNTTYCDDGTNYSQFGNTTYGSDGSSYTQFGNTIYGNDGSSYTKFGNTTYGSEGSSYTQFGNTIYGNDGSSYTKFGNTTYGSEGGNVFISCPTNSSYDSLSGNCKCDYGYVVSGSSCVIDYSTTPAYSSIQNNYNCPINSHLSTIDKTKCQCDSGYQVNLTKDACVLIPPKTNDQICQDSFGSNVYWDGTKTSDGYLNCKCKIGYQWNGAGTACIKEQVFIKTNDQICQEDFGLNVSWDGTETSDGYLNCDCKIGYQWNSSETACIKKQPPFALLRKNVNILRSPFAKAQVIGVAKKGLRYSIIDSTNKNWIEISFGNYQSGWLMRKYVDIR